MAENKIQIMLEMIDKASPEFKRMNAETIAQVKQLEQQANTSFTKIEKSSEKTTNALQKFSTEIRKMRQALLGVTIVMAIAVKGLNDAAEYNKDAAKTSDAFNKSLKGLSATLGQIFAPAIQGLTVVIDAFRTVIVSALGGFIKLFSFTFEFLSQMPQAFGNVIDNIKAVFTGDDPIGIVEGFQNSFQRAIEVANIATDQILQDFESTRANIEAGKTLDSIELEKIKIVKQSKERQTDIEKKELVKRAALREADQQNQLAALNFASEMVTLFGNESKAAFYITKAIAAAEIIVNAAAADMAISARWAWNPPVAAALIASNHLLAGLSLAAVAAAAIAGSFAQGSASIPKDMLAQIHQKEMIIPATFSESIRRGELTLGGKGGGSFGDINIFIQGGINSAGASINEMAEQLGFAFEKEVRLAKGF